jgi:molybdenum cofactor cytidylyltransferase
VVTAAGRSSRMGRAKALLEWRGLPLLAHQVRLLSGLREVIVVLGHEAAALRPFVPSGNYIRLVENPDFEKGRSSSLVAGFRAISGRPAGILVVAVDQPLSAATLGLLFGGHEPHAPIAVPVYQGRRGHPVLFRGDLLDELLAIAEETDGLRAVVARHRAARQEVPVDDPAIWLDLNEPVDYLEASAQGESVPGV